MERIKQALERARQERQASGAAAPPGARPGPQRSSAEVPSETNIVYSHTRTIEVPAARLREKRVVAHQQNDAISDAYKVLRTHVLQRMRANGWSALAVTSPADGNGKTLTCINLAMSLAREVNHSVLLVDLDLRRPSVRKYFTDEALPGIGEYLMEDRDLSELLFTPGMERLVVLPGNRSFANSSEMLSSPKMVGLAEDIKNRYPTRIVVVDLPPILASDDVLVFVPYVDAVMLVVEEGRTSREELRRTYDLLKDHHIIGTVLNKSRETASAYGYY